MQMIHVEKINSLYSAMHFYLTSWEHFIVQMEPCKDKKNKIKKKQFFVFPLLFPCLSQMNGEEGSGAG